VTFLPDVEVALSSRYHSTLLKRLLEDLLEHFGTCDESILQADNFTQYLSGVLTYLRVYTNSTVQIITVLGFHK
jgi:hypothetical protein